MNSQPAARSDTGTNSLEQRQLAFEQQRLDWESQRQQQLVDLNEQARLLREAWQRLENQQRAVMHSKLESRSVAKEDQPTVAPTENERPTLDSTFVVANELPVKDACRTQSGPSAIEQFRLLQRDVQSHQTPNPDSH